MSDDFREVTKKIIYAEDAINAIDKFNVCGYVEEPWEKLKDTLQELPPAQPEQFNPCVICQEFDCTGCKFRRT